jgi:hypothetical protein
MGYQEQGQGFPRKPGLERTSWLSWRWDALQTARTATREEDVLEELLGRDGYNLVTERPWLRVDVTLRATLPLDSPLPMPGAEAWRRWVAEASP